MEKFVSGALSVTVHSSVTYCVIGKNKATALDDGNEDIEIVRECLRLDPEHFVTRLRITNTSDTMMKLIDAYPFVSDDFTLDGTDSAEWMILNGTRQINDVPAVCTLGVRDDSFSLAADRLGEEGIMLKNYSGGDAVLSGDGITIVKAGQSYASIEIISTENQLTDISFSLDCNGSLKAVRAGGEFNCLLERGDIRVTDWVRISVSGNFNRLIADYAGHCRAVHSDSIHRHPKGSAYALTRNVTPANLNDRLNVLSHLKVPFDYFEIGCGWQRYCGDWEASGSFSDNMRLESAKISASGYCPGIWTAPFLVDKRSELFSDEKRMLLRHADGSICKTEVNGKEYAVIDVSSPSALEWLEMLYQRLSAYGYYFHDVDYTNVFVLQKDVVLANPTLSVTEAYIGAMETIKNAVGEEGYLHVSNGFTPVLTGIADSVQICSDALWDSASDNRNVFKKLVNQIVHRGYMGLWWHSSPGALIDGGVLSRFNAAEVKMLLVCEYMCSGFSIAGNLSGNEELKLLRHIYPAVDTVLYNRDMFSGMTYVDAVDIEVKDSYHTICFINWGSEEVSLIFRLDSKCCGGYADHASQYDVSSFFGREYVRGAKYDDIIRLGKIAPGAAEIVKIIKSDTAHILLSDMHFSMGGEVDISLSEEKVTVSGDNKFNCRGNYLVALPQGCRCDDGKGEFSFTVSGRGSFRYEKSIRRIYG